VLVNQQISDINPKKNLTNKITMKKLLGLICPIMGIHEFFWPRPHGHKRPKDLRLEEMKKKAKTGVNLTERSSKRHAKIHKKIGKRF